MTTTPRPYNSAAPFIVTMGDTQSYQAPEATTTLSGKQKTTSIDYLDLQARFCAPTHTPIPIVLAKGLGAHLWDIENNKYIDFLSAFSVAIQGHSHPRVVEAMTVQAQKLALCTSAFQNEHYPLLCQKICEASCRTHVLKRFPLTWENS